MVVAGVSGFVGTAVARELADGGRRVFGLSRRAPVEKIAGVEHIPVDLRDVDACRRVAGKLSNVTHLVYAAVNETPGDLVSSWNSPAAVTVSSVPLQLQVGNVQDVAHEERHLESILDPELGHRRDKLLQRNLQLAPCQVTTETSVYAAAQ
ncbi:MAG: hypothetical protein QOI59_3948 [Gammaproteobacteria bacterium]|nr:hypothetical protein [Gammaproteobacteria bacterium]